MSQARSRPVLGQLGNAKPYTPNPQTLHLKLQTQKYKTPNPKPQPLTPSRQPLRRRRRRQVHPPPPPSPHFPNYSSLPPPHPIFYNRFSLLNTSLQRLPRVAAKHSKHRVRAVLLRITRYRCIRLAGGVANSPSTMCVSRVTRHTSHVTHHTSHVTRHTLHVTRHTSHVTRHTSHVTRHTSHDPSFRFSHLDRSAAPAAG